MLKKNRMLHALINLYNKVMRVESSKVKEYLSFNLEGTLLEPLLLKLILPILN
jgi:hypothetical protein